MNKVYEYPVRATVVTLDNVVGKIKQRRVLKNVPHYMIETSSGNRFWCGQWELKLVQGEYGKVLKG
jgi:hypothetical protein